MSYVAQISESETVCPKAEGVSAIVADRGASDDVSNPSDCAALTSYVDETLGPLLHGLVDQAGR